MKTPLHFVSPQSSGDNLPWYKRRLICWVRDCAFVLCVFWALSSWQTRDMLQTDGTVQIPPMRFENLNGNIESPFSAVGHELTLVYFFAPWCAVCKLSMPNLNGIDEHNINVVRVALDYTSKNSVADFVNDTRVEGPIYLGNIDVKKQFHVPGYPSYYLLDSNNNVIGRSMGFSTEWGIQLRQLIISASKSHEPEISRL